MRYRRLAVRLLIIAAVVCCASLAYFAYGKYRVSSLAAACVEARQAKHWPQLEQLSTQWIEWEQDKAQPWLYAAEAASAQGENIRTASYLYYLPNDDPRTPAALLELSHMQFGFLNQPIAAAQTCERILRIQPENSEAHRRLIFFFAMSRQRARMIEEARRAIRAGCDTPETYLYLIGADWITFTNGYEVNQRWLQSAPNSETFQVAAAYHWVRSNALDESIETPNPDGSSKSEQLMNEMSVRFPRNLEILAFHLELACFRGNEERATELLSQAPPDSADDSRFWRFKGWVHEARGEFDEAEAAYEKALELHPFDSQAHHYLAGVYRRRTQPELVEKYQSLAVFGKEVMRDCLQSTDTQALSDELLAKMATYAERCGDAPVSERLWSRLAAK